MNIEKFYSHNTIELVFPSLVIKVFDSHTLEENPENLKLAIEKLIALHKLIAKDKGESAEAEEIRCDLDHYHKQLSWEDRDWLRDISESLSFQSCHGSNKRS